MRALTTFGCLSLLSACGGSTPPAVAPGPPAPSAPRDPAPPSEPVEVPPPAEPAPPARAPAEARCEDRPDPMSPVMLTPRQWEARRGAGVTKLSELKTTKDDPAEACMAAHSYLWLSELTCDDGSRPLADASAAKRARIGNVGPGGKCGNIVDRYEVSCPEGDVQVFVDMYWCTEAVLSPPPQGA